MGRSVDSSLFSLQHKLRRTASEGDLHESNNKSCEQQSEITNFTRYFSENLDYRQVQGESLSSSGPRVALRQCLERWHLDTCCDLDDSTLLRTAREHYDREHMMIEKAKSLEKTELESLLERAMPELPGEAINACKVIEKYLKDGEK